MNEYIESLKASGVALTASEWYSWIRKECMDYGESMTDYQINKIIDELEDGGLVKG